MTNMVRWDPFSDLRKTMDSLFDEGFSRPWRALTPEAFEAGFPLDVSQTEDAIEVKASLPGVKPEDVDITVQNDVLTIRASHRTEQEDKKREFYRREIRHGSYQRSFSLPMSVDADKAEASFEHGELVLRLPKAESVRPKQIRIGGAPEVTEGTTTQG
jgi:HSP20 family protein